MRLLEDAAEVLDTHPAGIGKFIKGNRSAILIADDIESRLQDILLILVEQVPLFVEEVVAVENH